MNGHRTFWPITVLKFQRRVNLHRNFHYRIQILIQSFWHLKYSDPYDTFIEQVAAQALDLKSFFISVKTSPA